MITGFCFTNVSERTLSHYRDLVLIISNFKTYMYNMFTLAQSLGRVADVVVSFNGKFTVVKFIYIRSKIRRT